MTTSQKIRDLLTKAKVTRYRICKLTGIDQATLGRVLTGEIKDLRVGTAEALLDGLGYELRIVRKAG